MTDSDSDSDASDSIVEVLILEDVCSAALVVGSQERAPTNSRGADQVRRGYACH